VGNHYRTENIREITDRTIANPWSTTSNEVFTITQDVNSNEYKMICMYHCILKQWS